MDVCSDFVSTGGHHYVLTLVDRHTRYMWAYGMRVMSGSDNIQAMYEFFLDYGKPPKIFYTNFVKRMIKVDTQKWLLTNKSKNVATPSGCQSQNRPVKRTQCSIMKTRRAYLTKKKFLQEYWFYTISYA